MMERVEVPADLENRYGAITAAQARALDRAAGVEPRLLMELAGWQVARCAWEQLRGRPARVLVLAGRGNNGGDGAVVAGHLAGWGCQVAVRVVGGPDRIPRHLQDLFTRLVAAGVEVAADRPPALARKEITGAALVIDALLGTGLTAAPRSPEADVIEAMRGSRVLAVDVPSGLDANSGRAPGACVLAGATCTLGGVKRGLWTAGPSVTGDLHVADIGIPISAWTECGLSAPTAVTGGALAMVEVPGSLDHAR